LFFKILFNAHARFEHDKLYVDIMLGCSAQYSLKKGLYAYNVQNKEICILLTLSLSFLVVGQMSITKSQAFDFDAVSN
jgi:hypothetical protein